MYSYGTYLVSSVNYSVLKALAKLVYYLKNKPAKAEASVYLFGDRKKPFHGMSAVPYASSGGGAGSSAAVVTGTGSRSAASQKFTVVMPQNSSNQRRARR